MRDFIKITVIVFVFLFLISTFCNSYRCRHSVLSIQYDETFIVNTKNPKTPLDWSEDVRLTFVEGKKAKSPATAVNDNIIHVVYTNDSTRNVYYLRSQDNGRTWYIHKKVSNITSDGGCFRARIAINGTNLHVVWDEYPDGGTTIEIYYANSTDNGETWNPPLAISIVDSSDDQWPDIAVWDDNIHVVWGHEKDTTEQYELCYRNSTDGGKNWNSIQTIENSAATQGDANIVVNGSNVHVVWGAYVGNWETYYKKSTNSGITWGANIPISKIDGYNSDDAAIVVNGSNIHVVWRDSVDEIIYRNSSNNGDTWNDEIKITLADGIYSYAPSIAVNNNSIHIVWVDAKDNYDYLGAYELYYKSSSDGGINFGSEIRLTNAPKNSILPSIASTNNYVHVVWQDNRTGGNLDYEIYYKRSPDFGNAPPEINEWYPQTNVTITETQTQLFSVNASDQDNDTLTHQWYLNDSLLVNETKPTYTFIPGENFFGDYSIKVSVSDGIDFANHTWVVTVINVRQLQETINNLQIQLYQLNESYTKLLDTLTQLSNELVLIWSQLNSSELNNTELQTRLQELNENFTTIRTQLNLSNQNNTLLQNLINNLNQTLNLSNEQITILWSILNQSLANESEFRNLITQLNQSINSLQGELDKLKEENEQIVREREVAEERLMIAAVVLVGVILICVLIGVARKKK